MLTIQTSHAFPLSSVKPLDLQRNYRAYCLKATRNALLQGSTRRRERSPVGGASLEPCGAVEGFPYARDPETGSLFLTELPDAQGWATLLTEISRYRHSPEAFHLGLAQSRTDHVYAPKITWIQDTLRLQHVVRPRILEVVTLPSDLTCLLQQSGTFAEVFTINEMELALAPPRCNTHERVHAAVLLESLDHVDDPVALVRGVYTQLVEGGLVFITALVSSGFDMAVLGLHNLYLYPPDRANCFSLRGLTTLLTNGGFTLLEVSTPGVLDVEIVRAHVEQDPAMTLSSFERQLLHAPRKTQDEFQTFLQQHGLSSFTRIVARKLP